MLPPIYRQFFHTVRLPSTKVRSSVNTPTAGRVSGDVVTGVYTMAHKKVKTYVCIICVSTSCIYVSSTLFASDHKIHRKYHENKMNKKEEKERK